MTVGFTYITQVKALFASQTEGLQKLFRFAIKSLWRSTRFMEARFSRLAASIQSLGGIRPGAAQIFELPVLLTGEASILATPNGEKCFLDAFRLLVRMTKNISVFTDGQKELERQVRITAESLTRSTVHFLQTSNGRPEQFAAILNIGCQVRPEYPWTTINSNGFLARVSSKLRISGECSQV